MKELTVSAKAPKLGKESTVVVQFPENLEEAKGWTSEQAILDGLEDSHVIYLQAVMRRMMTAGEDAKIEETVKGLKPGVKAPRTAGDPIAAATAKFASMTPDEQKAFIASLKKAANSGQ